MSQRPPVNAFMSSRVVEVLLILLMVGMVMIAVPGLSRVPVDPDARPAPRPAPAATE
jgi:hypothetical protein